jgi:hypothetical protein
MIHSRLFGRLLIVAGIFLAIILGGVIWFRIENERRPERLRVELVRTLAAATSPREMEQAVQRVEQPQRMGAIFLLGDGSWIAIGYRSSHESMWFKQDCAVALDSEGKWYPCHGIHFCANLVSFHGADGVKQRKEHPTDWKRNYSSTPPPPPSPSLYHLYAIANAANLAEARRYLTGAGFVPMNEPTRPGLTGKWPDVP